MTDHDAFEEDGDLADGETGNMPMPPTEYELDGLLRAMFAAKGNVEANDAVEALMRDKTLPESESVDADIHDQIVSLLEQGRKIKAIKLYREQTGAGLKDAKDAVETLATVNGIIPKRAGCAGIVLLMVVVSTIIGVGMWVLPG